MNMCAIRLHGPGGYEELAVEQIAVPDLRPGEALVRVHAAAITRDELEWAVDRLPAIPSYELSGIVSAVAPVDLVLDTVGGDVLARSATVLGEHGRLVSVAEEPPPGAVDATYFVVEPNRDQLVELARLVDEGTLRPAVDSVFPLAEARAAFERVTTSGKRGKVVLRV